MQPFPFHAIAVFVIDKEYVRIHSLHVDGFERRPGEPIESLLPRVAEWRHTPPRPVVPHLIHEHHISAVSSTRKPYICTDLERQERFPEDSRLLEYGIRSYISLPLVKRGELLGTVDFLSFEKRDFDPSEVQLLQDVSEIVSIAVSNALAYEEIRTLKEQLQAENRLLQDEIVQRSIYEEIVGSSQLLQRVLGSIDKVAPTDSTVLVTGETGTGKELIAHAIHRRSPRSGRALVKVNCAALPAELIASELFGHEKGAFTGALQQRIGRFETAHGGTIFLDEIGELTQEMQIALLRVLQEKEFERVGGNKTIHTDVRVIAATNRNLQQQVADGHFRMDLYYRLNVFPIHVPPLRERPDDIPVLVDYFISRFARRMGKRLTQIDRKTSADLESYSWPGNIRELQNVIERGVILAENAVFRLEPGTLPKDSKAVAPVPASNGVDETPHTRDDQRAQIESVLRETKGRISGPDGAAARLGVPASTLESRIRALKINKHLFRG
jgi:formate hydrogenlyase transcriptional activator